MVNDLIRKIIFLIKDEMVNKPDDIAAEQVIFNVLESLGVGVCFLISSIGGITEDDGFKMAHTYFSATREMLKDFYERKNDIIEKSLH